MQGFAADTKTWAAALLVRFSAKLSPTGGFRLPSGKHGSILLYYQTFVKKKMGKKVLFLDHRLHRFTK